MGWVDHDVNKTMLRLIKGKMHFGQAFLPQVASGMWQSSTIDIATTPAPIVGRCRRRS